MTTKNYPLEKIDGNPWQTRKPTAEATHALAKSIAAEGLLQVPVGRIHPDDKDRVQLAFGHTRLASYLLLNSKAGETFEGDRIPTEAFTTFPIEILKMEDPEMAEAAIRENNDRTDLSPIEEAEAMKRYMKDFDKTTADVAELYGLKNASSVRTKLRLLNLPKGVQKHLRSGVIPERTGRQMIGVANVNPSAAENLAASIVADIKSKRSTPDDIQSKIAHTMLDITKQLCSRWEGSRVDGEWWYLTDEFVGPLQLTPANLRDALKPFYADTKTAKSAGTEILRRINEDGLDADAQAAKFKEDPEAVRRIEHMLNPPPCSSCEHRHTYQGAHYCSFDPCRKTKREDYKIKAIEKTKRSRKLKGVAWYSKKEDGAKVNVDDWQVNIDEVAMFKEKHEDLRLFPRSSPGSSYYLKEGNPLKDHPFAKFVVVGKTAAKAIKKRDERNSYHGMTDDERRIQNEKYAVLSAAQNELVETLAPLVAPIFEKVQDWPALRMIGEIVDGVIFQVNLPNLNKKSEKDKIAEVQRFVALVATVDLFVDSVQKDEPPNKWIQKINGRAKTYGLDLPKGWAKEWVKSTTASLDAIK